ncbi:hypothetical protein BH23GEM7_BH23GEM7_07130 [soil metagenome]
MAELPLLGTELPPHSPRRGSGSVAVARALVRQGERAMQRASDAVLIRGNQARLLVDGPMGFRAWLERIERAERWIHLENYIIRDDRIGRLFRDALAQKAREGVRVRVLYDWVGCWATPRRFWRPLRAAGVEVRAFGPPSLHYPLNLLRRDHRKLIAVDGEYASVAGICIGDEWAGDPAAGVPPWRDTGAELLGPVAAMLGRTFARTWAEAGAPLPPDELPDPEQLPPAGEVGVRVVEGEPGRSRIYRVSQLIAVGVTQRLWITDPYFIAPPAMTEALAAAARDGVDVRVIVPAYNNWPVVGGMSRASYRPLLHAGVRLFEWEGPMIHAKTAVADGIWSRVGSSNLNLASLLSNWELDVTILGRDFAAEMELLFRRDLASSVEILLHGSRRVWGRRVHDRRATERSESDETSTTVAAAREARRRARRGTTLGRTLGRMAQAASVLGRALIGQRRIGREDAGWVAAFGVVMLLLGVLGALMPRVLAWPSIILFFWLGLASLFRALSPYGKDRGG